MEPAMFKLRVSRTTGGGEAATGGGIVEEKGGRGEGGNAAEMKDLAAESETEAKE